MRCRIYKKTLHTALVYLLYYSIFVSVIKPNKTRMTMGKFIINYKENLSNEDKAGRTVELHGVIGFKFRNELLVVEHSFKHLSFYFPSEIEEFNFEK